MYHYENKYIWDTNRKPFPTLNNSRTLKTVNVDPSYHMTLKARFNMFFNDLLKNVPTILIMIVVII